MDLHPRYLKESLMKRFELSTKQKKWDILSLFHDL